MTTSKREAVRARVSKVRRGARGLRALTDDQLIGGIEGALDLWRRGAYIEKASTALAAHRGENPEMIREGLSRLLRAHERAGLERWLHEAREEVRRLGAVQRPGPELILQVLAGNVAALAIPAVIEALLARSGVIVKPAHEDPIAAGIFLETLKIAAPALSEAVEVTYWPGGDTEVESALFSEVDLLVVSGREETVASIRDRATTPLWTYGPRNSIGILGRGILRAGADWWDRLSMEIALWEQRGCLSPRLLLAEDEPEAVAAVLAGSMARREAAWPSPQRSLDEARQVQGYRARFEMDADSGVLAPGDVAWTVVWNSKGEKRADASSGWEVGPPHRVIRVAPLPGPEETARRSKTAAIQAAGIGPGDLDPWRLALVAAGVPRVCPILDLQAPPAGWRADGRSGLAELIGGSSPPGIV